MYNIFVVFKNSWNIRRIFCNMQPPREKSLSYNFSIKKAFLVKQGGDFFFFAFPQTVFPVVDYFSGVHIIAKYIASSDMASLD